MTTTRKADLSWEDDLRPSLIETIVYHQRASVSSCACGWSQLGESHAEHIVEVFEQCFAARMMR